MSLTRIDCALLGGPVPGTDTSACVAVSPARLPGTLMFAGSSAARHSLGGQVAFKLGLEHFLEAGLEFFDKGGRAAAPDDPSEETLQMLESAFRRANNSVYQFGHRLAAGGRLAASLLGIVIERDFVAAGRVGEGSAYLFRRGELFPFFELPKGDEQYIGSNSVVSVELASVPLEQHDRVLVFSRALTQGEEAEMVRGLSGARHPGDLARLSDGVVPNLVWGLGAQLGPQTIYLTQVAS
jgi:serine/threonine protein phosphatase PrpC